MHIKQALATNSGVFMGERIRVILIVVSQDLTSMVAADQKFVYPPAPDS
jgi:hypothetical protein